MIVLAALGYFYVKKDLLSHVTGPRRFPRGSASLFAPTTVSSRS
jgi:hypothetical protein